MQQKFETPSLTSICISASHFLCFFHLLSNLLYKSPNHPLSDLCFNCSTAVVCTLQCFTVGMKWIQYAKNKTNLETKKRDGKKRMKFGKWSLMSFPAGKPLLILFHPHCCILFSLIYPFLPLFDSPVSTFVLSKHHMHFSPTCDSSTNEFKWGKMHTKHLNTLTHIRAHSTSQ